MSNIDNCRTYFRCRIKGERTLITKEEKHFFLIFILTMIFKFAYLGYSYIPFLDDYVQYGLYPNLENVKSSVLFGGAKTIYTRPFAALTDVYLIGRLGLNNLGVALFVITLLHAVSAVLFFTSFKGIGLKLSSLFLVLYALSPITTEGTYWISSSSRIVLPLFFLSMSLYLAVRFNGKYGAYGFIFIWLFNILSYGYYEQITVVSLALTVYFAFKIKDRKMFFTAVVNFILLAIYYMAFARYGNNSGRFSIGGIGEIFSSFNKVAFEIYDMWVTQGIRLNLRGFKRGLETLIAESSFLWLIVMSVLVLTVFSAMNKVKYSNLVAVKKEKSEKTVKNKKLKGGLSRIINDPEYTKIAVGALLFVISYTPFFISGNTWLNFRNAAASILGLSVAVDGIVNKLLKVSGLVNFISAILIMFFLIVTVSEITDYMNVAHSDLVIVQNTAESVTSNPESITVTLKRKGYIEQNAPFRDHIMSLTNSEYGICGAVRAMSGNYKVNVKCEFTDEWRFMH